MRVKDLGSRPVSSTIREFLSRMVPRHQSKPIPVERRQIPYWQLRGWTRQGDVYSGAYQTPYGAFQGSIEQERSGGIKFYLGHPSDKIRNHSHWTCFQFRGDDWYLVHMSLPPKDVSSGIITIERLIKEAHES